MRRRRWLFPLIALALAAAALAWDRSKSSSRDIPPPLPPDQRAPLRFDVPTTIGPASPAMGAEPTPPSTAPAGAPR